MTKYLYIVTCCRRNHRQSSRANTLFSQFDLSQHSNHCVCQSPSQPRNCYLSPKRTPASSSRLFRGPTSTLSLLCIAKTTPSVQHPPVLGKFQKKISTESENVSRYSRPQRSQVMSLPLVTHLTHLQKKSMKVKS